MNSHMSKIIRRSLAGSIAFCTIPAVAFPAVPAAFLEEITVTARKRSENLQDVPISITAFNAEDIENFGFQSVEDISYSVPNFQFSRLTTLSNSLSIRGISSADSAPGFETGVAVILDDVYIGRAAGFSTTLLDIERIEVLRGPQGTIQGRNVIGGSINIVTAKPSNDFFAKLKGSYGNYDQYSLSGVVSGPLIEDKVAGKIAVARRYHDGYGRNISLDKPLDTEDAWSFRTQLRFTPTEDLEILLTGDYDKYKMHDFHSDFGPCCVSSPPAEIKDRITEGDVWNTGDREVYGAAANIYYTFPNDMSLVSVTSYRRYDVGIIQEGDPEQNFGPSGIGTFVATARNDQDQWQFSQEVRLLSPEDQRFRWLGGLYYYRERLSNYQNFLFGLNADPIIAGSSTIDDSTTKTESYAAFGSATFDMTTIFSVTAGLRYTYNKRRIAVTEMLGIDGTDPVFGDYVNMLTLSDPAPTTFDAPIILGTTHNRIVDKEWSGDLTFTQNWTGDISTFAKYARGFKGGGFNAAFNSGFSGTIVEPEFIDSFELGLRSYLLDRKLRFNVTGFYMKHKDQQILAFNPATFRYDTRNEPSTRSIGAEFDLMAVVTPDLTVSLALGLIDAKFTAGANNGNKAPYTSPVSVTAAIRYTREIAEGLSFYAFNETSWRDGYYMSADAAPISYQQSYWWITARAGIQSPDGNWSVGVYGRNITNEKVLASASDIPGLFSVGFLQEPRTYGVEAQINF